MNDTVQMQTIPPTTWGPQAVRVLIEHKQTIEERLREQRRWEDFSAEMNRWRAQHLDNKPFAAADTALALYGICQSFGLIEIIGQGSRASLPTLGAMRGAPVRPPPDWEAVLRELASRYG